MLEAIDDAMLAIHHEQDNKEHLTELERQLHTLKGGARMVDAQDLADIAHNAETLLSEISEGIKTLDNQSLNELQTAIDKIQNLSEALLIDEEIAELEDEADKTTQTQPVQTFQFEISKPKEGYRSLLEQVIAEQKDSLPEVAIIEDDNLSADSPIPEQLASSRETIRLPAKLIDKMVGISTDLNINQARLSEHLQHFAEDIDELMMTAMRLHHLLRSLELETEEQIRHSYEIEHGTQTDDKFDPLEMDQYSEIQQLSRFIQEGLNDLGSIEKNLSAEQARINQVLKQQSSISREMQQELLSTRLTEISLIIPRLQRIARQTASSLNKEIEFIVNGEQCELDRVVLQKITAPLEHMLRNAISHGIESPEQRKKQGKPRLGKITFDIQRDGAEIVMQLSDDGQGINKEAVYQKAVELGLIKQDDVLSDNEIYRLIFHSGLSTTETLDQISGRGVGMDVAYNAIKNMGGSVQLESSSQGTTFTIRLPLTLATNNVLLIEVSGEEYAIPMSGIIGLKRIRYGDLQKLLKQDNPSIRYNQQDYRIQRLAHILQQADSSKPKADDKFPLVFVHIDQQHVAFQVDKIIGNREVVIKPLNAMLHTLRLYSAATIQTDGKVILILNTSELVHRKATKAKPKVAATKTSSKAKTIMVVDDSITIRKVTEKLLRSHAYHVVTAKDGMHALEKINDYKPDLMLLDIEMPKMDGFELLANLRNSKEWKDLAVIMISSRTGEKHRKRAEEIGINAFLGKPYQEETLLEHIQTILAGENITC